MIRFGSPLVRAVVPLVLLTAGACSKAAPTQPEQTFTGLPAPVPSRPVCGAVSAWPEEPFALAWRPVDRAATYTLELDCLGCGSGRDPWVSQSGTPWRLQRGLDSPSYRVDVAATVRRDGGRALRWRVWAVDRAGREGAASDWCITVFSQDGLPTPSPAVP